MGLGPVTEAMADTGWIVGLMAGCEYGERMLALPLSTGMRSAQEPERRPVSAL